MPGAIIAFDQTRPGGPSFGSPGVARNDLWLSREVTCRSTSGGNASYAWQFLDVPTGSAAALADASTANARFTPDLPGSYRLQLTTNGGGPGNIQILVAAVRYDVNGALVNRGWRVPAVGELQTEDNFNGQTRGWSEAFEFVFQDLLSLVNGLGGPNTEADLLNRVGGVWSKTTGASLAMNQTPQVIIGAAPTGAAYDATTNTQTGEGPFVWYARPGARDVVRRDLAQDTALALPLFGQDPDPRIDEPVVGAGAVWVPNHSTTLPQLAKIDPLTRAVEYFSVADLGRFLAVDEAHNRVIAVQSTGTQLALISTQTGSMSLQSISTADTRLRRLLVAGGFLWIVTDANTLLKVNLTTFAVETAVSLGLSADTTVEDMLYIGTMLFLACASTAGNAQLLRVVASTVTVDAPLLPPTSDESITGLAYDGTVLWAVTNFVNAGSNPDVAGKFRKVTAPTGAWAWGDSADVTTPAGYVARTTLTHVTYDSRNDTLWSTDSANDFVWSCSSDAAVVHSYETKGIIDWLPTNTGGGGGGGGGGSAVPPVTELPLVSGMVTVGPGGPQRIGARYLDLATRYPTTVDGLTRSITFEAFIASSSSSLTTTVRLQNVTDSTTLETFTTSSVDGELKVSVSPFLSGESSAKQLEVQLLTDGVDAGTSQAICFQAQLVVTYS